jgi:hypothetical protein
MKSHPFTLIAVLGLILFAWSASITHARDDDLKDVNEKMDLLIELQLSESLRNLSERICRANGNKQDLQKIYYEKASAYRRMTGERFEPPACDHS